MFEAVISLCMGLQNSVCRDALLPGYEAPTRTACLMDVPPGARCQKMADSMVFGEVAPGVFVHVGQVEEPDTSNLGDVSNFGFVIGNDAVAVIDTGAAAWIGEDIWRAIRSRTDKPISHVVLTHMHPDHVLGASIFPEAEIVGHHSLPRALADRRENYLQSLERLIGAEAFLGTDTPTVTMTVESEVEIDLGGRILTLQAWPSAHTGSDLTVLDVQTGTLFAGDLMFHRHTPALDGKLRGWQSVLTELQDIPAARVVPGHGDASLPWPMSAEALERYLHVLAEDTLAAIAAGERLGDAVKHIAQSEEPHWELFHSYNPRNATVAFTELEWE